MDIDQFCLGIFSTVIWVSAAGPHLVIPTSILSVCVCSFVVNRLHLYLHCNRFLLCYCKSCYMPWIAQLHVVYVANSTYILVFRKTHYKHWRELKEKRLHRRWQQKRKAKAGETAEKRKIRLARRRRRAGFRIYFWKLFIYVIPLILSRDAGV